MLEPKYIVKFGEKLPEEALAKPGEVSLNVSEFFFDTIQGEGRYLGTPAAFLRLQGCPVNCKWCDTAAVWNHGCRVSISWLLSEMERTGLADKMLHSFASYHLVVTGGSPLLQQSALAILFEKMSEEWKFVPFIEIENECSLVPTQNIARWVSCWNNSPKLSNSGVPEERRVNLEACMRVEQLAGDYQAECWWKFVVKDQSDIDEIFKTYSGQFWSFNPWEVYLMPMGASQEEYFQNRERVVELAIQNGFRYSPREHIAIWNQKTGI